MQFDVRTPVPFEMFCQIYSARPARCYAGVRLARFRQCRFAGARLAPAAPSNPAQRCIERSERGPRSLLSSVGRPRKLRAGRTAAGEAVNIHAVGGSRVATLAHFFAVCQTFRVPLEGGARRWVGWEQ